jgi:transposase
MVTEPLDFRECALAALIESFGGADVISFSAQFVLRGRRAGALLARTWFGPRQFLSLA